MKWEKIAIEDLCLKVTSGGTPLRSRTEFYDGGTIPWIKTKEVNFNRIYDADEKITEKGLDNSSAKLIPENSILIAMYGDGHTAGRCAINRLPVTTNQACCNLVINPEKANPDYMFYKISTLYEIFRGLKSGGSQQNLNAKTLREFQVQIPPLPTQRKIASILSAYDDLIENNLKRIKLLEEKAFLRYKSEFDFFKPSNEINKIPEGWFVKRAEEIFKINIGKTPPREQSEWFNDDDSKVKWVSIKDINNSTVFAFETSETVTEMAVNKFNMNVAKAHTVLLSFKLTVGKVAIATEVMTTNEAIAHFNIEDENQMCSEYIYFYLKNFPYDSLGSTSSIGTAINSKVVKAMPVLLPPKKVINDYKKDVENDFNLIQNLLKQNTRLREARDILLPRLMNGQLEV